MTDFAPMLAKIKAKQWALADVDWDAPGAELITDEQRPKLTAFMADLVWIENVGARGFAAMARKAPTAQLREVYRYFHAEEQRHANAELALMKRWGMLEGDEVPEPNINVRMAIEWLDRYSDGLPISVLGTVIPMLEVALDGALVKFLLDEVQDPVCHEVFRLINADEARHLAVDFQVLDMLGAAPARELAVRTASTFANPVVLLGFLMYVPLLNKMRDNIVEMGLSEKKLYQAIKRFAAKGDKSHARNLGLYRFMKGHAAMVTNRSHPYHLFADLMVTVTDRVPARVFGEPPTWARSLTHEAVAV